MEGLDSNGGLASIPKIILFYLIIINENFIFTNQVQGIYSRGYAGSDIKACDRSYNTVTRYVPHDYYLIACADAFSKIRVFRYPAIN